MPLSKQHFDAIAETILWSEPLFASRADQEKFAMQMAATLKRFNGHLDLSRFVAASTEAR